VAVINGTITPKMLNGGKPLVGHCDDGTRWAVAKITIPTGTTYSQTDRIRLTGFYDNDFESFYGVKIIRQVIAQLFGFPSLSTSLVKFRWNASTQRGELRGVGNGGSVAPAGPIDEVEVANGFAIAAGPVTADAHFFF